MSCKTGTEVPAESQKCQKAKKLYVRMSYKITSAQQLGKMTWKLLSAGKKPSPLLALRNEGTSIESCIYAMVMLPGFRRCLH